MILIMNCMLKEKFAISFNKAILRPIDKEGMDYSIFNMNKLLGTSGSLKEDYSHLIISGSEASVLDDYQGNSELEEIIKHFIKLNKPVLGIC